MLTNLLAGPGFGKGFEKGLTAMQGHRLMCQLNPVALDAVAIEACKIIALAEVFIHSAVGVLQGDHHLTESSITMTQLTCIST